MTLAEIYIIGVITSVIYCCVRSVISFRKINNPEIKEESYDKLTKHYFKIFQIKQELGERGAAIAITTGITIFSFLWFVFIPLNMYRRLLK